MLPIGSLVRRTGYYKIILIGSAPMYSLGAVLMTRAPNYDHSESRLLFALVIATLSRSSFEAVKEVALLSSADDRDAAIPFAMMSVWDKVGGMIGTTLADVLWSAVLPNGPRQYLSAEALSNPTREHPLLAQHLALAVGSPERLAVQKAYNGVQRTTLIIASAIMVLALGVALSMNNVNVLAGREASVRPAPWLRRLYRRVFRRSSSRSPHLPAPADSEADIGTELNDRGPEAPYCNEDCELGYLHHCPNLAKSFLHVHHPQSGDCFSVAVEADGTPFILYPIHPVIFTEHLRLGRPLWRLSEDVKNRHAGLGEAIARAIASAWLESGMLPIAIPDGDHPPFARFQTSETERTSDLPLGSDRLSHRISHHLAPPSLIDEFWGIQSVTPTPHNGYVSSDWPAKTKFPCEHRKPVSVSGGSDIGQEAEAEALDVFQVRMNLPADWTSRPPTYPGMLCRFCGLEERGRRCVEAQSWVHVHLGAVGMCWTFRWEAGPHRSKSRLGMAPDSPEVGLSDRQVAQLRSAIERNVSDVLGEHYGPHHSEGGSGPLGGSSLHRIEATPTGYDRAQGTGRDRSHNCGCSACSAANATLSPFHLGSHNLVDLWGLGLARGR